MTKCTGTCTSTGTRHVLASSFGGVGKRGLCVCVGGGGGVWVWVGGCVCVCVCLFVCVCVNE